GALLGSQATALVTIRDSDPAGTFSLTPTSLRVAESAGQAVLTVRRTGGASGTVTIDYATSDGSAQDGLDYTGQTATLTFAPGQTVQQITVPIAADGVVEGEESFALTLVAAGGGGKLGSARRATVTITSPDAAVQFVSPTYQASEAS